MLESNIITLWNERYMVLPHTNSITESDIHAPRWRVELVPAIPPKGSQSQSAFLCHRSLSLPAPNLLLAGDGI